MSERKLHCNDGHDLCHCSGRAECHNCATPLAEDYVKEPLPKDHWLYDPEFDTSENKL